mgnify:CR=1 FL=1
MEQKKEKGLRIRSCLTGAIWLALVFSTVISALLFAFLNHFFNLPGSIPVLGWLLIFNTLIAGLITSFINAKLLEPITRLSKAMKEVSQGDFEQHLETNSRIAEVGESYQSFNVMTKELRATEVLQMEMYEFHLLAKCKLFYLLSAVSVHPMCALKILPVHPETILHYEQATPPPASH